MARLGGGEAERSPAAADAGRRAAGAGGRRSAAPNSQRTSSPARRREERVVAPALEMHARRQRLQQLHQRHRPVRPQRERDGQRARPRTGARLDTWCSIRSAGGAGRAPGHQRDDQRNGDDDEVGAAGEDAEEERPADQGQERDVQRGRMPAHAGSAGRRRHLLQQALDHLRRRRPRHPQLRSQDEAMRQRGHRHRLHVVGQDEVAAADGRLGPGELQQGEAAARRGARAPRGDRSRVAWASVTMYRSSASLTNTSSSAACMASSSARLTSVGTVAASVRRSRRIFRISRSASRVRIADADPQQEAVELRLRQRIGALQLDGVLRGDHQERLRQRERLPLDRHLRLLHGLQQRRLRLGRGAVDLVGEQQVGEDGAGAGTRTGPRAGRRGSCR